MTNTYNIVHAPPVNAVLMNDVVCRSHSFFAEFDTEFEEQPLYALYSTSTDSLIFIAKANRLGRDKTSLTLTFR